MSENKWNYIQTEDLIQAPSFKRTKHDGYLEESVDEYVKEIREKYSSLANEYNDRVYENAMQLTELNSLNEQVAQLKQTNESLTASRGEVSSVTQEEHDQALANITELQAQLEEARTQIAELETAAEAPVEEEIAPVAKVVTNLDRPVGPEDRYTYKVRPVDGDNFYATVVEFPELEFVGNNAEHALDGIINLVDDKLMEFEERGEDYPPVAVEEEFVETPAPVVAPSVSGTLQLNNEKSAALLNAASEQAAQLVKRTEENMLMIEAAAKAEAEAIVAEAKAEAEEAERRASHFNERAEKIRERMEIFHASQLNELRLSKDSTGYDPTLPEDGSFSS